MPATRIAPLPELPADQLSKVDNPLPTLLQTPSGLAILELQGTINAPEGDGSMLQIGRLVFPHHDPNGPSDDKAWMKQVYLYIGDHQRMTGEARKLNKPLVVLRKRCAHAGGAPDGDEVMTESHGVEDSDEPTNIADELQMVEVIRYKIVFASRPEPTGVEAAMGRHA